MLTLKKFGSNDKINNVNVLGGNNMEVKIEKDICIGCGLCVNVCPKVFKMDDNGKSEVLCSYDSLDSGEKNEVLQSKDMCPVGAISLKE